MKKNIWQNWMRWLRLQKLMDAQKQIRLFRKLTNLKNYLSRCTEENKNGDYLLFIKWISTIEASYNMAVEYADAGCRMMEVDFPSRNPYLESDYIAGRMKKALEACDDYEKYMDSIVAIQKRLPDVKILVLAYENTVEEIGVDRFIEFCLTNNLKDILLVGLKDDIIKNKIIAAGLQVSCYVQFHLPKEEVEMAKQSNGFVYLQAKRMIHSKKMRNILH